MSRGDQLGAQPVGIACDKGKSKRARERDRERPVVGGDDDDTKSARDDCDGD